MAHIGLNGLEDKKQPTTQNPANTGAQGSTVTGTNIFGGAVPNRVKVEAGTPAKPGTSEPPKNDTPVAPSTPGAETNSSDRKPAGGTIWNPDVLANRGNTGNEVQTAEQRAETSLAQLRDDYSKTLREQYNYSADKLKAERDAALRENWILQQQAEAALPEKMAAGGINGGANATSLAALRAMYQGNRNDIQSGYMDELGDLQQQQSAEQAEVQKDYNERWIEYLLSLAKEQGRR